MMKFFSTRQEENTFVAKIKLSHYYGYRDKLLSMINKYLLEFYGEINYKIDYESSNILILNFHQNTDMASCVSRFLKIVKLEYIEFYKLVCNLNIKIVNSNNLFLSQKKNPKKLSSVKLPDIQISTDETLKKFNTPSENVIMKPIIKNLPNININKSVNSTTNSFECRSMTIKKEKPENKIIINEKDILSEIRKSEKKLEIEPYNHKKVVRGKNNGWLIQSKLQQNNIYSNIIQKNKFVRKFSDKNINNIEDEKKYNNKDNKNEEIKITEEYND